MDMANPVQLTALLRFHLSELGAHNAHHEFEHLARHVARARIYSNILPATGPVSAGGDGGRDFETFQTYISPQTIVGSTFAQRSSQTRQAVFQCSLDKRIEKKIRSDLQAIVSVGHVDEIVYFCEANLPIARRLKLIAEANKAGVVLQIFDGTAIAEWLAEPDIFWIAQEFLHLPAEITPDVEPDNRYAAHRAVWKSRSPLPVSRADFVAIKSGLRRATFDPEARPDLAFWLERMEGFVVEDVPRDLVRDASYEIAVAHLRGRGDLTPQASRIADYFSDAEQHTGIGELTNAVTLLSYCFGAFWLGQYQAVEAEFHAARQKLAETLEAGLAEKIGPGRRAGLLYVRGLLEQTPRAPGVYPDHARAISDWNAMLDSARDAPLYPVEAFADFLVEVIKHRGDDDALLALAARADDLLAERLGSAAAGEKAIDRAFSLLDREETTAAIRELHKAKYKWFSGERLGGTLRVLLLLSEQYRMLGLAYAAKYHAMAAAFIARYEPRDDLGDLQSKALLELVDAEDFAGNSFAFLQLFPQLFAAHFQHDDRPLDPEQHPRLHANLGQLAALLGFLKRGNPAARAAIDELTADWPALVRDPIWFAADQSDGFWNQGSWTDAWAGLEKELLDRPFGDIGADRLVRWKALGINWTCAFANRYEMTSLAEQLICELQLAACSLAGRDLGLIPCDVTIEIVVVSDADGLEITAPTGADQSFRVTAPSTDRGPDEIADVVMVFATIIRACSTLEDTELMSRFDGTVLEPIFIGRPYAELFREFVPEDAFAQVLRSAVDTLDPDRPFDSKIGEFVTWFDGPGHSYDEERARGDAEHRYARVLSSLRFTLERLAHDPEVRPRLQKMHDKGMNDWEIISILSNIAMNARMELQSDLSLEAWRERGLQLLDQAETPETALDPVLFTEEQIELHSWIYLGAFLSSWQLPAPPCMNREGLERFLIARYRLRDIDVDHTDVFGWATSISKEDTMPSADA